MRAGLVRLSQRLLGPNSIVQAALPEILSATPQHFFDETVQYVEENARNFYNRISRVPGLRPVEPQGAMYMMVCKVWKLCIWWYMRKVFYHWYFSQGVTGISCWSFENLLIELPRAILALNSKFWIQTQKIP